MIGAQLLGRKRYLALNSVHFPIFTQNEIAKILLKKKRTKPIRWIDYMRKAIRSHFSNHNWYVLLVLVASQRIIKFIEFRWREHHKSKTRLKELSRIIFRNLLTPSILFPRTITLIKMLFQLIFVSVRWLSKKDRYFSALERWY